MSLKIGKVPLGTKPVVCAVLQSAPSSSVLKKLNHIGVRLVELRVDRLKTNDVKKIRGIIQNLKKKFSVLLTIRCQYEGGGWTRPENERLELYKALIPSADAIDIEVLSKGAKSVVKAAHAKKKLVITSFHDFDKTPSAKQLAKYVKLSKSLGADIAKIAAFSKSKKDYYSLMEFTLMNRDSNIISIAMGKTGQPSRVLFPLLGSLITYGFVGKESAKGQFPVEKLAKAFQLHCC